MVSSPIASGCIAVSRKGRSSPSLARSAASRNRARAADRPFDIRESPIQGLGAFPTRPIASGTRLIEYAGERLTPAQADARYPDVPDERHHTFLFAIDDDVVIDAAVDGNDARW